MSLALVHATLLLAQAAFAAPFSPAGALRFAAAPEEIAQSCQAAKRRAEMNLGAIVNLPESARTFANTPEALDLALWELSDGESSDTFLKYVSVSSSVRSAANDCETLLGQFAVEVFGREDLFKAVSAYAAKKEALSGEKKKLLEKELLDFKRNGLLLPAAEREQVREIKKKLVELEASFGKNLNEVKDFLTLSREELAGLPEDYIARLKREGDRFVVTLDYPDYFPFMNNGKNADARRRLEFLFNNRALKDNLPILKEVLSLRRRAAALLGYRSHAHYILEDRMAKTPGSVDAFVSRLDKKLKVLAKDELKVLVELKAKEEGKASDGIIHAWDWRYYDAKLKRERYEIDLEKIKEYFPMATVTEGMLAVYQKLLGLKFRIVEDAVTWNEDAKLYEVTDAAGGPAIAYFYMDLFPREGKYKHAAAFDLIKGRQLPDGTYQRPVSAIVANFNKPSPDRPSLLKHGDHEEVETYFHEFGHIMHQTLTRAQYGRFSGSSTARDFVEAPSQMLQNWVWDPEVLASLSGHYKNPSQKLPPELLGKMIAAKNVNSGLVNLRQLFFASIDMSYHGPLPVADTTAQYQKLAGRISMIPMTPGTHPEASFGHLMGYDAGYYGYMWSKVYAEDMFSRFAEEGILNPVAGRRYRENILEPGSSRDEMESLKTFLGREPNEEAFLKSLGLTSKRPRS
ncbi:MAG: M3 family metallopeptidase [Elusimicrobiota bacterium]